MWIVLLHQSLLLYLKYYKYESLLLTVVLIDTFMCISNNISYFRTVHISKNNSLFASICVNNINELYNTNNIFDINISRKFVKPSPLQGNRSRGGAVLLQTIIYICIYIGKKNISLFINNNNNNNNIYNNTHKKKKKK
eukprot:GHVR01008617.1.p1 GENE.GHVR01008617.1~~GHVR01008617.1.p1  ORF type:complete len:138 (-),score=39.90 GHVR01008617.1:30-443(-)